MYTRRTPLCVSLFFFFFFFGLEACAVYDEVMLTVGPDAGNNTVYVPHTIFLVPGTSVLLNRVSSRSTYDLPLKFSPSIVVEVSNVRGLLSGLHSCGSLKAIREPTSSKDPTSLPLLLACLVKSMGFDETRGINSNKKFFVSASAFDSLVVCRQALPKEPQ